MRARTPAWVGAALVALVAAAGGWLLLRNGDRGPPERPPRPVVFVHGMGASAARIGTPGGQFHPLLPRIAATFPRLGVCQRGAEPRPWDGSPCVFRYIDDPALAGEPGAPCPCRSDTGIIENAEKLAAEVSEVARNAGDRVILVGYSLGGAIVRAYLGLFHERADREVAAAILVDPATTGSWGFALDVRRHIDDPLLRLLAESAARVGGGAAGVDVTSEAYRDLQPRSDAYRLVARAPLPARVSTYTFWGDIRLELSAGVFGLERSVEIGDVALLPGDPDPQALPILGGQRFRPTPAPGAEALEFAHTARMELGPDELAELAGDCVPPDNACLDTARRLFDVPNAHGRVPTSLEVIRLSAFGRRMSLADAILEAVRRNA